MKKSLLAGITALAVVLSSGVAVFAATDTTSLQTEKARPAMMANLTDEQMDAVRQARSDSMTEAVAALVADGTLTQDIADKLSEMPIVQKDAKIISNLTEEQQEAVQEAMKAAIAKLVADGTLTEDEADTISVRPMKIRTSENCTVSGLTEEQRAAIQETMKEKLESKLSALVNDGTLSQELADQFLNGKGGMRMGPGWKNM